MKKIGLTGGIGVGKTYVSKIFQKMGIPIFNADEQAKKCMIDDANLILILITLMEMEVEL